MSCSLFDACVAKKAHEKLLAQDGVDENQTGKDGAIPLYIASENGHLEVVERLLAQNGVNVNEADRYGRTSLYVACSKGHTKVVDTFLAQDGVDVNQADKNGATPLFIASQGLFFLYIHQVHLAQYLEASPTKNHGRHQTSLQP